MIALDVWSATDEEQERERERERHRILVGLVQVDQAVRRQGAAGCPIFRIPTAVAVALGWPLCRHCDRSIVPWQVIRFRHGDWHPRCIAAQLKEIR